MLSVRPKGPPTVCSCHQMGLCAYMSAAPTSQTPKSLPHWKSRVPGNSAKWLFFFKSTYAHFSKCFPLLNSITISQSFKLESLCLLFCLMSSSHADFNLCFFFTFLGRFHCQVVLDLGQLLNFSVPWFLHL